MTIGNFDSVLGTSNNDDILLDQNGAILYSLAGDDNLALNPLLTEDDTVILVGGSGSDRYTLNNNQFAVVFDNGNSSNDSLVVEGIGIDNSNSYFLDIDNRHLYVFDTDNQQYILLLDWQNSENQIEAFQLDNNQQLSYQELVDGLNNFRNTPDSNYLGNFTFEQLNDTAQSSASFPLSEALIDLDSFGLTPATIDADIQVISDTANALESSRGSTVYRFYNRFQGVHFYTADENERNNVRDNLNNYEYEGESYVTVDPLTGNNPEEVYRFFNSTTGVHLYTTQENERDNIIDTSDNFTYEGVKFYAYETEVAGTVPIHRFYEPNIGVHFYTPNEGEKIHVENNLLNYIYEGVAYYAFPIDEI